MGIAIGVPTRFEQLQTTAAKVDIRHRWPSTKAAMSAKSQALRDGMSPVRPIRGRNMHWQAPFADGLCCIAYTPFAFKAVAMTRLLFFSHMKSVY